MAAAKKIAMRKGTRVDLLQDLESVADERKARNLAWFFKTGPGEYGEGDVFLGITVPVARKIALRYTHLSLKEIARLLASPIHEHRFCRFRNSGRPIRAGRRRTTSEDIRLLPTAHAPSQQLGPGRHLLPLHRRKAPGPASRLPSKPSSR